MTPGFYHDYLVDSICDACESRGIPCEREYVVRTENGVGFIDLVAFDATTTLALEVERSNRRIENDVAKAVALQADGLLIVVPNPQVRRLVKRRIRQLKPRMIARIHTECLPEAILKLESFFPMQPGAYE